MKQVVIILFLLFASEVSACPMCNIHNYLYASVNASTKIYRGKVVASKKDNKATIEVLEIIKNEDKKTLKVGELIVQYLFDAEDKIGNEYIFSNPMMSGVKFEILDTRHEWEVKYLIDSTRSVSSVTEAIRLLECVSRKSNQDGLDYIKANFETAYDSLYFRIAEFRNECQANSSDFYNAYRLTNLTNAFLIQNDSRTRQLLLEEIKSIQVFDPGIITVDSLKYNGSSPLGEYLRQILKSSQKTEFNTELIAKYIDVLNDSSTSSGIYFAYALSFNNVEDFNKLTIGDNNVTFITLGLLSSALWYRAYWQRDNIKPLLAKIEEINKDPKITEFINKRFDK